MKFYLNISEKNTFSNFIIDKLQFQLHKDNSAIFEYYNLPLKSFHSQQLLIRE